MPIGKDKFEKAKKPIEDRIYDFLFKNKENAYTWTEMVTVCENLGLKERFDPILVYIKYGNKYNVALQNLIDQNLIQKGEIGGETYYGIT